MENTIHTAFTDGTEITYSVSISSFLLSRLVLQAIRRGKKEIALGPVTIRILRDWSSK